MLCKKKGSRYQLSLVNINLVAYSYSINPQEIRLAGKLSHPSLRKNENERFLENLFLRSDG